MVSILTASRTNLQTHYTMLEITIDGQEVALSEELTQTITNLAKVKAWINRPGKVVLHTHVNVDADAAFSAALMLLMRREDVELEFLPTDATVDAEDALAVDMMNGNSAIKGIETGSAFGELVSLLVEANLIPKRLYKKMALQLNLTDSGKRCNDRITLAGLVKSWKYAGLEDRDIVSRAHEILLGMRKGWSAHSRRREKCTSMPIQDGIALNLTGGGLDRRTLARRGAYLVINQHDDVGQSVVLTKLGSRTKLDLNDLEDALPDSWFIHPGGFIACFGSMKAKKDPSKSGISLEELCKAVRDWLVATLGFAPEEVLV